MINADSSLKDELKMLKEGRAVVTGCGCGQWD